MVENLTTSYESRLGLLEILKDNLEKETKRSLSDVKNIDRVTFRVKDSNSFLNKALDPDNSPPYLEPLIEIEDQVAGRVIVFFDEGLEIVKSVLAQTFNMVEFERRRPSADDKFGYESNHLICTIPPHVKPVGWDEMRDLPTTWELQIRTIFMHAYSEPQHNWGYKSEGELPSEIRRQLAWISASSWGADQAYSRVWAWYTSKKAAVHKNLSEQE